MDPSGAQFRSEQFSPSPSISRARNLAEANMKFPLCSDSPLMHGLRILSWVLSCSKTVRAALRLQCSRAEYADVGMSLKLIVK